MKKIMVVCIALLLMLIGNEVISLGALCALACIGLAKFLKAAAEGGAFD